MHFADIAVAIAFFVLLKPAGATLSLVAAALRIVYAAIQGLNLLNLCNALFLLTRPNYGAGFSPGQVNALASFSLEAFGTGFSIGLIGLRPHRWGRHRTRAVLPPRPDASLCTR